MARTKTTRASPAPGAGVIFALRAIGLVLLVRWLHAMAQMDWSTVSTMASSPWACVNLVFLFLLLTLPGAVARAERPAHPLPQWLRQALRLFALLGFLFAAWSVGAFIWFVGWRRGMHAVVASNGWLVAAPLLYAAVVWICRPQPLWRTNIAARRFAIGRYAISIDVLTRTVVVWMESRKVGQYDARELGVRWPRGTMLPPAAAFVPAPAGAAEPFVPGMPAGASDRGAAVSTAVPVADSAMAAEAVLPAESPMSEGGARAESAAPPATAAQAAVSTAVPLDASSAIQPEPGAIAPQAAAAPAIDSSATEQALPIDKPADVETSAPAATVEAVSAQPDLPTDTASADVSASAPSADTAATPPNSQPAYGRPGVPLAGDIPRGRPFSRPKVELLWNSPAAVGHNRKSVMRAPLATEGDRAAARALDATLRQFV
ncbi:hypothetical protein XF14_05895 [Burkholderia gladioli]|nr:hypothetical protein [Burkholderia gladioli]KKJ07625.1 hypothetical protein XF14_05895 [Burkholderia gladioli]